MQRRRCSPNRPVGARTRLQDRTPHPDPRSRWFATRSPPCLGHRSTNVHRLIPRHEGTGATCPHHHFPGSRSGWAPARLTAAGDYAHHPATPCNSHAIGVRIAPMSPSGRPTCMPRPSAPVQADSPCRASPRHGSTTARIGPAWIRPRPPSAYWWGKQIDDVKGQSSKRAA